MQRKSMSDVDLKGRVAIVTGASLGIGRATALALGRAGAKVVVNYRSHADRAQEVVGAIGKMGSQAIAVQADVADLEAVEGLVAHGVKQFGRVDIAVSNAAYSDRDLFYEADMAGFRRTVDVTMWGAFHLMRAATQQMIRQGNGGTIVLVSSPHAFIPAPRAMAYNMSKAAIEHAARTAAIEVAQFRIRINLIQPGWTDTPGELKFASRETLDTAGAKIPLGRLGTAEEMAEGILFLCDPRHEYMTGAALLIDGGISLPWWANRGSAAPG
jgi:glucose 1-dehydrogenase